MKVFLNFLKVKILINAHKNAMFEEAPRLETTATDRHAIQSLQTENVGLPSQTSVGTATAIICHSEEDKLCTHSFSNHLSNPGLVMCGSLGWLPA